MKESGSAKLVEGWTGEAAVVEGRIANTVTRSLRWDPQVEKAPASVPSTPLSPPPFPPPPKQMRLSLCPSPSCCHPSVTSVLPTG